jgi:two-component system, cell cycle sensor histidine kinase and response regulator CckA
MRALTPAPSPFRRYGVALAAALAGMLVHLLLHRQLGPSFDPLLVVVVGVSAWYGGLGAGFVTLLLVAAGTRGVDAVLPATAPGPTAARLELMWLLVYGVSGLVISALIAWLRAAHRYADAAREQVSFLSEVSEVLASSLDFRATLSAAARLAVPRLADWCAVDIVDTDGRLRRLAIAHTDPAKVDAVWAMSHKYREQDQDPVPQVIRTAHTQLIREIPDELLRHFARDDEHLEGLRAFGLRSLLIVPLTARGRTLGAITFVMAESGRRYGPAEQRLGEDLARRAAIAVDNARLFREAEEALQEKARTVALLDTVFRGAPVGLAFVDRALTFVRVNDALAALDRAPVEAHLGRTVAEVLGDSASLVVPLFEEVFRTGVPVLDREMVTTARDDEGPRTFLASYYPVAAPDGRTEWVGCMVSEVTERRRAAEFLVQAERMEAIARVAGGVAHEVNNMMTVITGFGGFLESSLPADDPRAGDVAEIQRAADRAAGITRQLLAYSRQQLLQPTRVDLNELVRRSVPALARLLGPGIQLCLDQAPDGAPVRADRAQLEQVLVNLVLNARDAMNGQGTLTVSTEIVTVGEAQRSHGPGVRMPAGRYARLTVSDTGHGMDAPTRARVFEPFFTTKPAGQGSGLGLATVYGIVKQSGGFIWVYSEAGQGTAFKIYLPEFTGSVPELPPAEPLLSPRGAETILIVEDESAVRRMAARALAAQGYAVLEAENGAEALELLARGEGPVDLVLSDVVMPRVNGRELGERLAVERPGLRMLFMSGYTDDDILRRGLLRPGSPFLQKPFMPGDLSRKVREVLDT